MLKRPTKLEIHRLVHYWNGHKGPLLNMGDLDWQEHQLLVEEIFAGQRAYIEFDQIPVRDPYTHYASVLAKWGIMCSHPESKREKGQKWFHCSVCNSTVIDPATIPRAATGMAK